MYFMGVDALSCVPIHGWDDCPKEEVHLHLCTNIISILQLKYDKQSNPDYLKEEMSSHP